MSDFLTPGGNTWHFVRRVPVEFAPDVTHQIADDKNQANAHLHFEVTGVIDSEIEQATTAMQMESSQLDAL